MEPWQVDHITMYLPELIEQTNCNNLLQSHLRSAKVLSDEDVSELETLGRTARSNALYRILKTRVGAYDVLRSALRNTFQTGSLQILETYGTDFRFYGNFVINLKEVLGIGRYTKIYTGKYNNAVVAIKTIWTDFVDPKLVNREAEFLSLLSQNDNIINYLHTVGYKDKFFVALELCYTNLSTWVSDNSSGNQASKRKILCQIAKGLRYIHNKNIVHGSLSPANILLTSENRIKISDFLHARNIANNETMVRPETLKLLAEGWIAPEYFQFSASTNSQGTSTDIFSFGCIVYFVISNGQHPFGHALLRQVNIIGNTSPSLKHAREECARSLIAKMVEVKVENRISISEVCSTLKEFTNDDLNNYSWLEDNNNSNQLQSLRSTMFNSVNADVSNFFKENQNLLVITCLNTDMCIKMIHDTINCNYRVVDIDICDRKDYTELFTEGISIARTNVFGRDEYRLLPKSNRKIIVVTRYAIYENSSFKTVEISYSLNSLSVPYQAKLLSECTFVSTDIGLDNIFKRDIIQNRDTYIKLSDQHISEIFSGKVSQNLVCYIAFCYTESVLENYRSQNRIDSAISLISCFSSLVNEISSVLFIQPDTSNIHVDWDYFAKEGLIVKTGEKSNSYRIRNELFAYALWSLHIKKQCYEHKYVHKIQFKYVLDLEKRKISFHKLAFHDTNNRSQVHLLEHPYTTFEPKYVLALLFLDIIINENIYSNVAKYLKIHNGFMTHEEVYDKILPYIHACFGSSSTNLLTYILQEISPQGLDNSVYKKAISIANSTVIKLVASKIDQNNMIPSFKEPLSKWFGVVTPVHFAFESNDFNFFEILVRVFLNKTDFTTYPYKDVVHACVSQTDNLNCDQVFSRIKMLKLLNGQYEVGIAQKCSLDTKGTCMRFEEITPLGMSNVNVSLLQYLIQNGNDPNTVNSIGDTVAHAAAKYMSSENYKALILWLIENKHGLTLHKMNDYLKLPLVTLEVL